MLDPRDLQDLVAIGRWGSLSAAAKRGGVAVSTVARRIATLEAAVGFALIDRRASGVRLTPAGQDLARMAEPLAQQLERVTRAAEALRGGSQRMPVRISATEFVVAEVLAPAVPALQAAGCDVPVHLQSQGDVVSLAARDADIAVRMVRPEGASLHIRKLAEIALGLFASRSYLAGRDPAALDLRCERLIVYDDSYGRLPELAWIAERGLADAIILRTGSTRAQLLAVLGGAGVALLPVAFARREPELVALPLSLGVPPRQPWMAVHRDLRRQPAIRLVQRWIVETFQRIARLPVPADPL